MNFQAKQPKRKTNTSTSGTSESPALKTSLRTVPALEARRENLAIALAGQLSVFFCRALNGGRLLSHNHLVCSEVFHLPVELIRSDEHMFLARS